MKKLTKNRIELQKPSKNLKNCLTSYLTRAEDVDILSLNNLPSFPQIRGRIINFSPLQVTDDGVYYFELWSTRSLIVFIKNFKFNFFFKFWIQ